MRGGGRPLGRAGLALLLMAAAAWAGRRPRPVAPGGQPRPSVVLVACDSLVSVQVREGGRAAVAVSAVACCRSGPDWDLRGCGSDGYAQVTTTGFRK